MEEKASMNRRSFFQIVAGMTGLALLSPNSRGLFSSAKAQEKRRGAAPTAGAPAAGGKPNPIDLPLVKPGEPGNATNLHYVFKHADVKKPEVKIEKQGTPFEKQFCSNCSFYTKVGQKEGSEVGTCTIFTDKLVKKDAWCQSWNKKV